jgi:hypothetical protein
MKFASRKSALTWVLNELASQFERRGWQLLERPKTSLDMLRKPRPDVEHTLLVHEPFLAEDLPSANVVGLTCAVNVFFPELEAFINQTLGRDAARVGKLSARLPLNQLVPQANLFAGNVHFISLDVDEFAKAAGRFVGDFDEFLEPVRQRLADSSVFLDEGFIPPKVDPWAWNLRRAAYYRLHCDATTWVRFSLWLGSQADRMLGQQPANDAVSPFFFADMNAVKRSAAMRGAEEVRQLINALKGPERAEGLKG